VEGGIGRRFVLEVAFLIALAIGVGVADLSTTTIVLVMALGWLLVCLFELAVWAEGPRFPVVHREAEVEEPPVEAPPAEEPAEVTEIHDPEPKRRVRFWRRRRPVEAP
jgi:hypothetical protein